MLQDLRECLEGINESIKMFREGAIELGNEHIIKRDPKYHKLIITKAELLIAISKFEVR
jgi:hypothetical protein